MRMLYRICKHLASAVYRMMCDHYYYLLFSHRSCNHTIQPVVKYRFEIEVFFGCAFKPKQYGPVGINKYNFNFATVKLLRSWPGATIFRQKCGCSICNGIVFTQVGLNKR